jgi:hypothetical protein
MSNSSYSVQDVVDDARSNADLAPALPVGGYSDAPALSIANDTMQDMIQGGQDGQPFNFKWNRLLETPFFTNSWQQDYFIPNLYNLGWVESCTAVCFSSTGYPKPTFPVEVKRDLQIKFSQSTNTAKMCWMQNDTMLTGTWGQATALSTTGLTNPGPSVVYTNPSNLPSMPINPTTSVKDAFGNLWTLTTYGTCGLTNPFITNLNPIYPSMKSTTTVATTVNDGTCVWTAVNPKGQGFRLSPIPGQTGPVYQINPVGQSMVPMLKTLQDSLDPIPDNFYKFFKQGFFTGCIRRSPDPKVRARFDSEYQLWMKALHNSVMLGANQEDDWGFVPGMQVMETGYGVNAVTPSQPFGPWQR